MSNLYVLHVFRCFQSKHGQAAIYVEATDSDPVTRRVADFEYDLQPLPRGKGYDPAEGNNRFNHVFIMYLPRFSSIQLHLYTNTFTIVWFSIFMLNYKHLQVLVNYSVSHTYESA